MIALPEPNSNVIRKESDVVVDSIPKEFDYEKSKTWVTDYISKEDDTFRKKYFSRFPNLKGSSQHQKYKLQVVDVEFVELFIFLVIIYKCINVCSLEIVSCIVIHSRKFLHLYIITKNQKIFDTRNPLSKLNLRC